MPTSNGANLGFEATLWAAADALRSNMDAAEYKHIVLGLIFLKYISDAFEERHALLETGLLDCMVALLGFCRAATLDDVRSNGHVLTPGRYVGAAEVEADAEPFEEKMARLVETLAAQQAESARLDAAIRANLEALGYGLPE